MDYKASVDLYTLPGLCYPHGIKHLSYASVPCLTQHPYCIYIYIYIYIYVHIIEYHLTYSVGSIVVVSHWNLVANSIFSYIYHNTCITFIHSPIALDL